MKGILRILGLAGTMIIGASGCTERLDKVIQYDLGNEKYVCRVDPVMAEVSLIENGQPVVTRKYTAKGFNIKINGFSEERWKYHQKCVQLFAEEYNVVREEEK